LDEATPKNASRDGKTIDAQQLVVLVERDDISAPANELVLLPPSFFPVGMFLVKRVTEKVASNASEKTSNTLPTEKYPARSNLGDQNSKAGQTVIWLYNQDNSMYPREDRTGLAELIIITMFAANM
jgi:hypothetical protein